MKTPNSEPVLRSRLLPRISFRFMFVVTFAAAVLAAIGQSAGEGGAIAAGVIVSVAFIVICFLVFAALFGISWCVSQIWYQATEESIEGNPFAEGQLPPQIIPPREQER